MEEQIMKKKPQVAEDVSRNAEDALQAMEEASQIVKDVPQIVNLLDAELRVCHTHGNDVLTEPVPAIQVSVFTAGGKLPGSHEQRQMGEILEAGGERVGRLNGVFALRKPELPLKFEELVNAAALDVLWRGWSRKDRQACLIVPRIVAIAAHLNAPNLVEWLVIPAELRMMAIRQGDGKIVRQECVTGFVPASLLAVDPTLKKAVERRADQMREALKTQGRRTRYDLAPRR